MIALGLIWMKQCRWVNNLSVNFCQSIHHCQHIFRGNFDLDVVTVDENTELIKQLVVLHLKKYYSVFAHQWNSITALKNCDLSRWCFRSMHEDYLLWHLDWSGQHNIVASNIWIFEILIFLYNCMFQQNRYYWGALSPQCITCSAITIILIYEKLFYHFNGLFIEEKKFCWR